MFSPSGSIVSFPAFLPKPQIQRYFRIIISNSQFPTKLAYYSMPLVTLYKPPSQRSRARNRGSVAFRASSNQSMSCRRHKTKPRTRHKRLGCRRTTKGPVHNATGAERGSAISKQYSNQCLCVREDKADCYSGSFFISVTLKILGDTNGLKIGNWLWPEDGPIFLDGNDCSESRGLVTEFEWGGLIYLWCSVGRSSNGMDMLEKI